MKDRFLNNEIIIKITGDDRDLLPALKNILRDVHWASGESFDCELVDKYLKEDDPIWICHTYKVITYAHQEESLTNGIEIVSVSEFLNEKPEFELEENDFWDTFTK